MLLSVYKAHAHLFKDGLQNFLQQVEQTIQAAEDLAKAGILTRDFSPKSKALTKYRYTWHCQFSKLDQSIWRNYRRISRVSTILSRDMHDKVQALVCSTNPVLKRLVDQNTVDLPQGEISRAIKCLTVLRAFRPCLYIRLAILCHRKSQRLFQLFQEIEDTAVVPVEHIDALERLSEMIEHLLLSDQSQPKYHHQS